MKIYINRTRYMAQAQAYAIKLQVDNEKQEVTAVIGALLRQNAGQDIGFSIDGTDYFELDRIEIRVNELRVTRNWSDRQVFGCSYEWKLGRWLAPMPNYTYSLPFRFTAFEMNQLYKLSKENAMVALNVPFADSTLEDCFFTVNLHPTLGGLLVEGVPTSDILNLGYETHEVTREMVFPSVRVTPPELARVGEPLMFPLQVVDALGKPLAHDAEIYLEAVSGYCPKPRIRTHQGRAIAKVLPLGLDAGDSVRLKAGFKFFPALDDAQVVLV